MFFNRQKQTDKTKRQLITRLDGRAVKYVTKRDAETSVESVIGRSGRINTKNGYITIICDGTEVFRCSSDEAKCGELLSLDGVIIYTKDENSHQDIMVVAYYKYYR
ncbi:MAG: hypothetical protein PHH84_04920 [Oscillospiraceae bacterium]|nr:hypothetical protein [Oscillospiraceae bacterium]MDD4414599.1 hypothetical protein [Oscillospiraceae bacterium]